MKPNRHAACSIAVLLLSLLFGASASAQGPFALLHSLFDPGTNAQSGTAQGLSVAIDGNVAVVGAPFDDVGATESGVVKVYDATTSRLLHSLTNPIPADSDWYGYSVAISGSLVLVGTPHANAGTNGAGSVYAYDLLGAMPNIPVMTLSNPTPALFDEFGCSIAISGALVVVGARYDDTGANDAGSAYVFDLTSASPAIPIATLTNPSPAANEVFGHSCAISGTWIVIGAYRDNTGATGAGVAYLYDLASAQPTIPSVILTNPSPAQAEFFGSCVAMSGTRFVVGAYGAKSAYVYDAMSDTPWRPVTTLTDPRPSFNNSFGYSVAISGSHVAVGDPNYSAQTTGAGSAYLFDLASASPAVPTGIVPNPGPAAQDRFGNAVAISGARFLVGAPNDDSNAPDAGSAYAYDLASATPVIPVATLNVPSPVFAHYFGNAVGISGSHLVVGAWEDDRGRLNAGSAYVYDLASLTPTIPVLTLTNPAPWFDENFGSAVAIDGTRIVIGAYRDDTGAVDAGIAYVYNLANATNSVPFLTLTNPSPASGDWFGERVAMSDTWVVVAARSDDAGATNAGTAYVYDLTSGIPAVPAVILTNPSPTTFDSFGFSADLFGQSAAISGTRVAVGAPQTKTGTFYPGSVYVFELLGHSPQMPVTVLTNPNPRSSSFGVTLAMSGARLVVGASSGISYVYGLDSVSPAVPVVTFYETNFFVHSVAISGSRVVISGIQTASPAPSFGIAYVYDLANLTPTIPIGVLSNPRPVREDLYGDSVAVDGNTFVVGAGRARTTFIDHGAAYIFGLVPELWITPSAPGLATISWSPTTSSGFVLQCVDGLASSNWLDAPSGAANPVTIPLTNSARFYRLIQP